MDSSRTSLEQRPGQPERPAWPSVSVVVPTRDRPELLRRAVSSILGQHYPGEIECLVVADQSDPPALAVQHRERRRLRVLRNQRTPGLAGARNSGVVAAEGELVGFCDDDDEWLPDKLRVQVEALQADPGALVVGCGISIAYRNRRIDRLPSGAPLTMRDFLRDRVMELHSSTFLAARSALLGPIGLIDEQIPGSYGEDHEWLLRAARVRPVLAVPEPLVLVRWHTSSFFAERWQTIVSALSYLLEKYPEFDREPRGKARIQAKIAFALAAAGERGGARHWARRALRGNWHERRAWVALVVSLGLVRGATVLRLAHALGRGI